MDWDFALGFVTLLPAPQRGGMLVKSKITLTLNRAVGAG